MLGTISLSSNEALETLAYGVEGILALRRPSAAQSGRSSRRHIRGDVRTLQRSEIEMRGEISHLAAWPASSLSSSVWKKRATVIELADLHGPWIEHTVGRVQISCQSRWSELSSALARHEKAD